MMICTEKERELRNEIYPCTVAACSSGDLSAKFTDDTKRTARRLPSLKIMVSSRTSAMDKYRWVDGGWVFFLLTPCWIDIMVKIPNLKFKFPIKSKTLILARSTLN